MDDSRNLHGLLRNAALACPDHVAVEDPALEEVINYRELDARSDAISDILVRKGIQPGDRVGLCGPKSIGLVSSIFAVLKAQAAYVPVDSNAPLSRNAYIFKDCSVKAIIVDKHRLEGLRQEFATTSLGPAVDLDHNLVLVHVDGPGSQGESPDSRLAYILYTSGSTGSPKGVMHTHASALSFIDWCSDVFGPLESDRFSSHAPFHFDLSILDVFVPIKHHARVVLIGEELGKNPLKLAAVIGLSRISIWYSTPTILRLLVDYGKLEGHDYSALRLVLFAGEVYPLKHQQALQEIWVHPRYFNLYGPTETNVCTYYEVPSDYAEHNSSPHPIGFPCSGDITRVADDNGENVKHDEMGELYVSGGSVMVGYWNLPEQNSTAFASDAEGIRWYKTGDIVIDRGSQGLTFVGRRDRMVKRRGYRVELGEIESALYKHRSIAEVAVIAATDVNSDLLITAFVSCSTEQTPSIVEFKRYCASNLPNYMIPDRFSLLPSLPKTSTDKVDYQSLKDLA